MFAPNYFIIGIENGMGTQITAFVSILRLSPLLLLAVHTLEEEQRCPCHSDLSDSNSTNCQNVNVLL